MSLLTNNKEELIRRVIFYIHYYGAKKELAKFWRIKQI